MWVGHFDNNRKTITGTARRNPMRALRPAALVAGAVGLAIVGLATGVFTSPSNVTERSQGSLGADADLAGPGLARSHLELLRRPKTGRDEVPKAVRRGPLMADGFVDATTARRVSLPDGEIGWVAHGARQSVCLVRAGFMTCPPAKVVASRGLAPSVAWRGPTYRIEGIAADGVRAVELELSDGTIRRAEVRTTSSRSSRASHPGSCAGAAPPAARSRTSPGGDLEAGEASSGHRRNAAT